MTTSNPQKLASPAKDLTKDYPRSPRDLLAGYVIGMRTLDKCRAFLNNSIGEYHFNCPLDNMFFEFTGISADNFKDFVATGATDEEVADWVAKHAKPHPRIEIIKWNNTAVTSACPRWETTFKNIWRITSPSLCRPICGTTSIIFLTFTMQKKSGWRRRARFYRPSPATANGK